MDEQSNEVEMAQVPQGFTFDEANHLYMLDGRPLTGVTTILGVIAKPALIQWAANLAAAEAFKTFDKVESEELLKLIAAIESYDKIDTEAARELDKLFPMWKNARTTHNKRKKEAAQKGTDVHAVIEQIVKDVIANSEGKILTGKNPEPLVQKFLDWAIENKIQFLESEKRIYSRANWYAGTCDLVFIKDGKKYVGDIKTSSGIYGREYFFQMAGYQIALEELGEKDFHASTIIRCGKDGSFEIKDSFDLEADKEGFLAALKLYRALEV